MRLRRMRNAETAFPTLPDGGFLMILQADNRPTYSPSATVGAIIDRPPMNLQLNGDAP